MATENQEAPLEEAAVTEAPAPAEAGSEAEVAQTPAAAPAPVSPEVESEARRMGWVPKDEWRGDPAKHRGADEFVERGRTILPIIKSQLDREIAKTREAEKITAEKLAAQQAGFDKRIARAERMNAIALEKQRDKLWNDFETEKRKAVEAGDTQAYDKLSKDQRQALTDFHNDTEVEEPRTEAPKPTQTQPQSTVPAEVQSWVDQNTWFNADPALRAFATKEHGRLLKAMPGISIEDNLRRTLEATKQKFPEEFGLSPSNGHAAPAQPHSPSVEGGGRQAQGTNRARGWNDLPPEAKKAGAKFIELGLFGADPKKAQAEYATDYWAQD